MTDFDLMILFAFRYVLGRMTYAPSTFVKYVSQRDVWNKLTEMCKKAIIKEIDEASERNALGQKCDKEMWIQFREKLSEDIELCNL